MSRSPIRQDKTCLNCRHVVDQRFCPNCGQENTDTRKTFHHLFVHFFEDLTHYENAFWKTIKNLLLRPASLTREYLSGKRLSYLAPVRLYIFISIVTFFLFAVIPSKEDDSQLVKVNQKDKKENTYYNYRNEKLTEDEKDSIRKDSIGRVKIKEQFSKIDVLANKGVMSKKDADSMKSYIKKAIERDNKKEGMNFNFGYESVAEMDSVRKVNPGEINDFEYWLSKKIIPINNKYTQEEFIQKFGEDAERNFPKTLFIYMPIFAFVLWLLHNKKRWYYFDHGIFTLHYFSFLLLVNLLLFLMNTLLDFCGDFMLINLFQGIIQFVGYIWMLYYFFPAHHRFYGETRMVSFMKSSLIYFVNIILFSFLMVAFFIYTFINLH